MSSAFGPPGFSISAGFDAHRADPLADMQLTAGDFADLTREWRAWPGARAGWPSFWKVVTTCRRYGVSGGVRGSPGR